MSNTKHLPPNIMNDNYVYYSYGLNNLALGVGLGVRIKEQDRAFDFSASFSSALLITNIGIDANYLYGKNYYIGAGVRGAYSAVIFVKYFPYDRVGFYIAPRVIMGKNTSESSFIELNVDIPALVVAVEYDSSCHFSHTGTVPAWISFKVGNAF